MSKEKVENYTAEVTARVREAYVAGATPKEIAAEVGKSERSVIAKLTREGVYISKEKAKGATRVTKANLVARIAKLTGATEEALGSMEKATHEALEIVVNAFSGFERNAN